MKQKRSISRYEIKQFYNLKRKEGAQIGKRVNELFQQFHFELKQEKKNIERLKEIIAQITSLRKEKLFRQEFPSLASFSKYLKKEKITLRELKELLANG